MIAVAIFWAACLYMVAVGFVSVSSAVFWPVAGESPARCADELGELKAELLADASARVARGGTIDDHGALRAFLARWDARHHAAAEPCAAQHLARAHADLGRLRHGMETVIRHLDRTQAPLAAAVDEALSTAAPDIAEDPSTP